MAVLETGSFRSARLVRGGLIACALAVAVLLLAFAWQSNHARHQRLIVDHVTQLDARVTYDYGHAGVDAPPGPAWLRQLAGDDFLARVVGIEVWIPAENRQTVAAIAALPHLRFLVLHDGLDDVAMVHLPAARRLEKLTISSPAVTDAGLSQVTSLKRLTHLRIASPGVTDTGLMLLESLPNLSYVELIATSATERGVERLRQAMPQCDVRVIADTALRL